MPRMSNPVTSQCHRRCHFPAHQTKTGKIPMAKLVCSVVVVCSFVYIFSSVTVGLVLTEALLITPGITQSQHAPSSRQISSRPSILPNRASHRRRLHMSMFDGDEEETDRKGPEDSEELATPKRISSRVASGNKLKESKRFEDGSRLVGAIENGFGLYADGYYMLSEADYARFRAIESRQQTIPVMIMDEVLLPGQTIEFSRTDPAVRSLIKASVTHYDGIVGLIGRHPQTGRRFSYGVTISLKDAKFSANNIDFVVRADSRFLVEGTRDISYSPPTSEWDQSDDSYTVANVELLDMRAEPMSEEQERQIRILLPQLHLLNEWASLLVTTGNCEEEEMLERMKELGQAPKTNAGLFAMWIAAVIDPLEPYPGGRVCRNIRPAMLAAKSNLERLRLVSNELKCSIDHLLGRNKLF